MLASFLVPTAPRRELDQLLRYELVRITPFPVEALFWRWDGHVKLADRTRTEITLANITRILPDALPATVAGGWHKVPLRISLNASWQVLMELVHAIERSPTRIFIDDIHFLSPVVVAHPAASPIQASVVLYDFRPADAGAGT
jgi:hypothetical protein